MAHHRKQAEYPRIANTARVGRPAPRLSRRTVRFDPSVEAQRPQRGKGKRRKGELDAARTPSSSSFFVLVAAFAAACVLNTTTVSSHGGGSGGAERVPFSLVLMTAPAGSDPWPLAKEKATGADLVVMPPLPAAAGSSPGGGDGCAGIFARGSALAASSGAAVAVACGPGGGALRLLAGGSGAELLRLGSGNGVGDGGGSGVAALGVARGFATRAGQAVVLGVALGAGGLRSPLVTRELMLLGAEVIAVVADDDSLCAAAGNPCGDGGGGGGGSAVALTHAALVTRGFENVAAVGLANSGGGSAAANWCNGWIADGGCEGGSALLAFDDARGSGGGGDGSGGGGGAVAQAVGASFDVASIRAQRRNGLWGDAMRAPGAYKRLCGFDSRGAGGVEAQRGRGAVAQDGRGEEEEEKEEEEEGPLGVRVAMLQMVPPADKAAATAAAEEFVRRAARSGGADIALTPEMWNVGWDAAWPSAFAPPPGYAAEEVGRPTAGGGGGGRSSGGATAGLEGGGAVTAGEEAAGFAALAGAFDWAAAAEPLDGPFVVAMQRVAREEGIAVAAGLLRAAQPTGARGSGSRSRQAAAAALNSVVLIDRHGKIVLVYDKVHVCVWLAPSSMLQPGTDFFVAQLDVGQRARGGAGGRAGRAGVGLARNITVGAIICADREFPEAARSVAVQGAELVLVPNACEVKPEQLAQLATRAAENVVAIAMTNYGGSKYHGRSAAFDAHGQPAVPVAGPDEDIVYADFDIGATRATQASPEGRAALHQPPVPRLCQVHRRPEYQRPSTFGRVK